jgi:pyruvate,water dikinase
MEIGRRLAARGRITDATHAFELSHDEVAPLLAADTGPSADELAARAKHRAELSELDPPPTLGPPEPPPPLDALPAALARMLDVVKTVTDQLARIDAPDGLSGTGVGREPYVGRVLRAANPEEAIARIEPGDVLVVPFTTPAYNGVLPLAGAIVTVHGGPLCHAAVLARELGIPAVVGAADAFTRLPDGATVEVDPAAGTVRVVETAALPT